MHPRDKRIKDWQDEAYFKLKAENERLRAAINRHRNNVWGTCPVGHDEDVELYAAVRDEQSEDKP